MLWHLILEGVGVPSVFRSKVLTGRGGAEGPGGGERIQCGTSLLIDLMSQDKSLFLQPGPTGEQLPSVASALEMVPTSHAPFS